MGKPTWVCAMTTVPMRMESGVTHATLLSIQQAGFPTPWLSIDGPMQLPEWLSEYGVTHHMQPIGAHGHWELTAWELYARNPHTDYYAIFQDDFACVRNARQYIDHLEFPRKGYLNLHTFASNLKYRDIGFRPSLQHGRGALALVFSHRSLKVLLHAPNMVNYLQYQRRRNPIDSNIRKSMRQAGLWEYVHYPSLTWHRDGQSAMRHNRFPEAVDFPGEDYDARQFIHKGHPNEPH